MSLINADSSALGEFWRDVVNTCTASTPLPSYAGETELVPDEDGDCLVFDCRYGNGHLAPYLFVQRYRNVLPADVVTAVINKPYWSLDAFKSFLSLDGKGINVEGQDFTISLVPNLCGKNDGINIWLDLN